MLWGTYYEPIERVPASSRVVKATFLTVSAAAFVAFFSTSAGDTLISALHTVRYTGNKIPSTSYTHSYKKDALEVMLYKRTHPSRNPVMSKGGTMISFPSR